MNLYREDIIFGGVHVKLHVGLTFLEFSFRGDDIYFITLKGGENYDCE